MRRRGCSKSRRDRGSAGSLEGALAAALIAACACTTEPPASEAARPPGADAGTPNYFPVVDASSSSEQDAGFATEDAGASPVVLGLVSVPASSPVDAGEPDLSAADQVAADVQVVASGARSTVLHVAWDELMPDGATVDRGVLSTLERRARFFGTSGVRVTLALGTVVGAHDRRPPPLRGRWSAPEVVRGFRDLVDELMVAVVPHLRRISVATLLDRWVLANDDDTVRRAGDFLLSAMTAVRDHELRPNLLDVGVDVTMDAALEPSEPLARVLDGADLTFVTYLPRIEDGDVVDPVDAGRELVAGMGSLSGSTSRAVVLHRFGYPSARAIGSSEEAQRDFFEEVVRGVVARPAALGLLNAWGLNDMSYPDCEEQAAEFGQPIGAGQVDLLCSMGLKDRDGRSKLVWSEYLVASARFFGQ